MSKMIKYQLGKKLQCIDEESLEKIRYSLTVVDTGIWFFKTGENGMYLVFNLVLITKYTWLVNL
jgi:hypothetical protein